MAEMLTAKDVQELLQIDRSTVYRMAEAGRLPAIKVGKQWRFPAAQIEEWVTTRMSAPAPTTATKPSPALAPASGQNNGAMPLADLLPLDCVQLIQDSHADLLGVMIIVTDMQGVPITQPSRPCGLFSAILKQPDAVQRCISSWHDMGQDLAIEPAYHMSHLGLLCARGLIRVGTKLQGMVVAGCIAPDQWPPEPKDVQKMADEFGISDNLLQTRLSEVYLLNQEQKKTVLVTVQRVANIVAHIVSERQELVGRLDKIAGLALVR